MRYRDAAAFRQALEQRLKSRAHGDGARLSRDRKRIVFDQLLARLIAVAPGQWLLKGGFALDLRLAERARATKDVDIDWQADEGELFETLIEASAYDAGDFFVYAAERVDIPADRLGGSHRFRITVALAGRLFETFVLDVGFRREEVVVTETLKTDDFLAFAGIAPVDVKAIPLEFHVAEKLHAYTRGYQGERPSTRAKDLVDLALIAEMSCLDADALGRAIKVTFERRDAEPVPTQFPPLPAGWDAQFRQLAEAVGIPSQVAAGHAVAAALLEPVLNGEIVSGVWDPERRRWVTGESSS